jgi:hypothetical protein
MGGVQTFGVGVSDDDSAVNIQGMVVGQLSNGLFVPASHWRKANRRTLAQREDEFHQKYGFPRRAEFVK